MLSGFRQPAIRGKLSAKIGIENNPERGAGMETDKQLYGVFRAKPEWVFLLARLPPVGKCVMRSLVVKPLERRSDGVIVPEAPTPPLSVIEFQFGENAQIYTRTAQKMAAVQEEFNMREVQGIIFFGDVKFDPQTKPWTKSCGRSCSRTKCGVWRNASPSILWWPSFSRCWQERARIGTEGRGILPHDQAQ